MRTHRQGCPTEGAVSARPARPALVATQGSARPRPPARAPARAASARRPAPASRSSGSGCSRATSRTPRGPAAPPRPVSAGGDGHRQDRVGQVVARPPQPRHLALEPPAAQGREQRHERPGAARRRCAPPSAERARSKRRQQRDHAAAGLEAVVHRQDPARRRRRRRGCPARAAAGRGSRGRATVGRRSAATAATRAAPRRARLTSANAWNSSSPARVKNTTEPNHRATDRTCRPRNSAFMDRPPGRACRDDARVPSNRRRMFVACRRNTSAAPKRQNRVMTISSSPHGAGVHVTRSTNTSAAPRSDAIET